MDDDRQERERVYDRIAPLIIAFAHATGGRQFHAEELRQYVEGRTNNIAPGSPDRILRQLRIEGALDYEVISRSESLYQFHMNGTAIGDEDMNMAVNGPKPSELVEEYIQLRDAKEQGKAKFEEWLKTNITDRMVAIEQTLLNTLDTLGVDSIASKKGTAYKKVTTSVTVGDQREFRRHVIGAEQWDLLNWSANKTVVNDLVERGEPIPPGVNRSAFLTIGIRRK